MLQDMDDSTDGRSKGLAHGEQLLDILDSVRDGLLAGGIPRATLNRLAVAVTRRHDAFADPKLQDVLDQIELRAHVELAKLEVLDKRTVSLQAQDIRPLTNSNWPSWKCSRRA